MTTFTTNTTNLVDLVHHETGLVFKKKTLKGEYAGACPFCHAGEDRFRIWPEAGRYWCRVCDRKGDAIQFMRDYKHLSFAEARAAVAGVVVERQKDGGDGQRVNDAAQEAPAGLWLAQGRAFVRDSWRCLFSDEGERALTWLRGRGLTDDILRRNGIGLNPVDRWVDRALWGLDAAVDGQGRTKGLWLPKGITIPWFFDNELWGVRIRRPVGAPKYYWVPGGTMGMYGASTIRAGWPVVLLEGELDALSVRQALTRPTAAVVATGSTQGGRRLRWLARLASASVVLVAYDNDDAGEHAAEYWIDALPNARRWRPYWSDANDMARDGADLAAWVQAGIESALPDYKLSWLSAAETTPAASESEKGKSDASARDPETLHMVDDAAIDDLAASTATVSQADAIRRLHLLLAKGLLLDDESAEVEALATRLSVRLRRLRFDLNDPAAGWQVVGETPTRADVIDQADDQADDAQATTTRPTTPRPTTRRRRPG